MIKWTHATFHALTDDAQVYHTLYTEQGLIVGFDDDIDESLVSQTIDLKGTHVYPGFVDSHLHLLGYGQQLSRPSLVGTKSKEEILKIIEDHPQHTVFEGYQGHIMIKDDLDRYQDRPIVLRHVDYHAATVNQYVLNVLGLSSADGILKEADANQAMVQFSRHSKAMLSMMFKRALEQLYRYGVTGGHSDDLAYFNGFEETLDAMNDVLDKHPFRAHLLMHHHILDDYLSSGRPWLDQHAYLQLGAIKIFYDGTFNSRTALVFKPYVDHTYGYRVYDKEKLTHLIKKIRKHHLPIAVHVIGDQALSELLDLIETYPPPQGLHDRMIHASLWQASDLRRATQLPLIFDIQPQFVTSDIPKILSQFASEPAYLYAWKSMHNHQLVICGGSDAPVEIPNPILGMYDAMYRETSAGTFHEAECLTRFEALKLYTRYANIPTYKMNRGALKVGFIADFTVMKEDILTVEKQRFKDNQVCMTVINEHIVYQG